MKRRGEWGEFFPISDSVFGYNESLAQEQIPLDRSEVLARGWTWREDSDERRRAYIGPATAIPDSITLVPEDFCAKVLKCEETGRPFKLVEPELQYYRRNNIPIPTICPDARHKRRLQFRNPRILWGRSCASCNQAIQTTYAPSRPEKVFCEACYQEHVYR